LGINKGVKNKNEKILDFLSTNPHEVYSPKTISNILNINYYTVVSSLDRFYHIGKVQKLERGKYVLDPLPDNQSTLDSMLREND